jgi:hypothetical protein
VPVAGGERAAGGSEKNDYLVIGRANAATMMVAALVRAGKKVEIVSHQDWRLTASYVDHIAAAAKEAVAANRPSVIVLIGLDESFFVAKYEEVHTLPATKGPDGKYHIHGNLGVAGAEAQKKLFGLMDPIWEATRGIKTLVVAPVVRYITESCCDDPDHMPNRHTETFEATLRTEVSGLKNRLKEHLFAAGHVHVRVLDPAMDMCNRDANAIWGEDPTMPRLAIYDSLVAAMTGAEARIDLNKKRPGEKLASVAKKPRVEMGATVPQPRQDVSRGGSGRGGGGGGGPSRTSRGGRSNSSNANWRGHEPSRSKSGRGWKGRGGGGSGGGGGPPFNYNAADDGDWWDGNWWGGGNWDNNWRFNNGPRRFGGGGRARGGRASGGRAGGRWRY